MNSDEFDRRFADILAGKGRAANPPSDAEIANLAGDYYRAAKAHELAHYRFTLGQGSAAALSQTMRARAGAESGLFRALEGRADLIG